MQHEAHDRNDFGHDMPHRDAAGDRPIADRPLADREVPLPGLAAADDPSTLAIHQWLDGEMSEADARRADPRQVALWNRIAVETDQRRRMVTPAYVAANIMNALPEKQVATNVATAMNTATQSANIAQNNGVSYGMMAVVGAAMLAVGFAIGKMF